MKSQQLAVVSSAVVAVVTSIVAMLYLHHHGRAFAFALIKFALVIYLIFYRWRQEDVIMLRVKVMALLISFLSDGAILLAR